MLYEADAVISVNSFLHLHQYFYTENKTLLELLQSFVIAAAVPLVIEWFFICLSIAIETRYQNRPIMARSLAKAMERVLNCCNCYCIADSDLDKQKPVDRCTGTIPRSK